MYQGGLEVAVQSLDLTLPERGSKGLIFDSQLLRSKTLRHLKNKYIHFDDLNVDAFLSDNSEIRNYSVDVLFPGLGTATGCVGGAVFGGALEFIEGAATGIAGSLLLTCFR